MTAITHPSLPEVIEHAQVAHRRRWGLWGVLLGLMVVAAAVALVVALRPGRVSTSELFLATAVDSGAVVRRVSATGELEARSSVEVGAQVSGRIEAVLVDYNDVVARDQILARFDTESLDAQLAQAEASVKAARAALAQARADRAHTERQRRRTRQLFERGIETQENLEAIESGKAVADAVVRSAAAQLELQRASEKVARTTRREAVIRSPIDGIVISRAVEPGQTVVATFQTPVLFEIAEDLSAMNVIAAIDEADVGEVRAGQNATFTVDAYPHRTFEATVTELRSAAKVIQNVVTYEAVLEVKHSDVMLRPGMTASAKIETASEQDVLRVPNAALRFTPPGETEGPKNHTVWVLRDDGVAPISVVPGISDGANTQVELEPGSDLALGDRVLVDLTHQGRSYYERNHE